MFQTALMPGAGDALDQRIQHEIRTTVDRLLTTGQWAAYHHPLLDELRHTISAQLGGAQVRLCPSGSSAIELALRACNLNAGDEVICSALDYPGNIRAIRVLDLQPVIVDVAADRFTISVEMIEAAKSPKTRAVLVSHLYGDIAPVDRLRFLCDQNDWLLIEDVCQMPGASLGKRMLGAYGHVSAFSFGGTKPVTCGAGGAVATNERRIAARIDQYVDRPSDSLTISPLQAAVLLPQWKQIAALTSRHRLQLAAWQAAQAPAFQFAWKPPDSMTEVDGLSVVYKLPVRIPVSEPGLANQPTWHQQLGEVFRPQIKTLPGRGRVLSSDNAVSMHRQYGLIDTRTILNGAIPFTMD